MANRSDRMRHDFNEICGRQFWWQLLAMYQILTKLWHNVSIGTLGAVLSPASKVFVTQNRDLTITMETAMRTPKQRLCIYVKNFNKILCSPRQHNNVK